MTDPALLSLGRSVLRPSDTADVVEWCEQSIAAIPDSPMPGPFRADRTPWIGQALRIWADPETRMMALLASIQSGKTLTARLAACHIAGRAPGPTLLLLDNDQNSKDFNLTSLRPLFDNCAAVKSRMSPDLERASTITFDRMTMWVLGAHNEKNLQRRAIRYLIGDECWLWPKGHIGEASARVTAFGWMGKRLFMSQGGTEGDDFDRLYRSTDQRDWHMACPECSKLQPWVWDQVRFPESARTATGWDKTKVAAGTTYECAHCHALLPDTQGTRLIANSVERGADFVATAPTSQHGHVGLHWNSLAAMSWGELGVMMLEAAEAYDLYGDEAPRRIFKQKRLALPWSEEGGSMVSDLHASEYKLADDWEQEAWIPTRSGAKPVEKPDNVAGHIPFRTAGIDVQRGHFWVVIRSWAVNGASRLRFFGKVDTWADCEALTKKHGVHPAMVIVDSGDQTTTVYEQAARLGWKVSKGSGNEDFAVKGGRRFYSDPTPVQVPGARNRVRLIVFSALALKDILYGLRLRKLHTYPVDAPEGYVEQMSAEVRVKDKRTGKPMWILPQGKRDNHAWDCEALALLVAVRWGVVGRDRADSTPDETAAAV